MAKWGEGDPRWIVEERADATNVNNWHWSEKNATPWSLNRLRELLTGFSSEDGSIVVTIDEIKKIDGEATANNRKAKLIFLFEWVIEGTFVARVSGSEDEYKGSFDIPNLSDENEASEVDVNTSITGNANGPHAHQIRQVLNKSFIAKIQDALAIYIRELKEEFSKGLILPTDQIKPQVVTKGKTTVVDKRQFQNTVVAEKGSSSSSGNEIFSTKEVSVQDTFKATPDRVFEVISDPQLVRAWSNNSIGEWNFKEGGSFSLLGGNVSGTFEKIEPNKEIATKWRMKKYPNNHHATIRFVLNDNGSGTDIKIVATEVPTHLAEETQRGLDLYYLTSIARTFGFSQRI
uniref:Aha1_N domain-containing protein n=1 Tax=Caenorhabditis japonica TaxID=281687 RepID=A0A8R1I257_CAEJA